MTLTDETTWPVVAATLDAQGHGEVIINGTKFPITAGNLSRGRAAAREIVRVQAATRVRRPVRMDCIDPEGEWLLTVHPDGHVDALKTQGRPPASVDQEPEETTRVRSAPRWPQPRPTHDGAATTPVAPQTSRVRIPQQPAKPATPNPRHIAAGTMPRSPARPASPGDGVEPPSGQSHVARPTPRPGDTRTRRQRTTTAATAVAYVKPPKPIPEQGLQGAVYKLTGFNPGPGNAEAYFNGLVGRVRARLEGTHNVSVLCLKGGIGKTTTTLGLGLTIAELRADQVLSIDMNPDAGDLADRALSTAHVEAIRPRTVTDLLHAIRDDSIHTTTELNRYTLTSDRLHLIAGEQTPEVSESLTTMDYEAIRDVVDKFYPLTITDCGTGVTHPAMRGILDRTDQVIIAAGWAVSGARRAERTLEWLAAQDQYQHLADQAVVVLSDSGRVSRNINRKHIVQRLGGSCRAVHVVPFDHMLSLGDSVNLHALAKPTRSAYLELAATVVDGLAARR